MYTYMQWNETHKLAETLLFRLERISGLTAKRVVWKSGVGWVDV